MPSRITTDIDFDRDGRQLSFLRLPHSSNTSGYGWIPIPAACLRNGPGPTLLLVGGNHGDEYEGQITVGEIIRTLDPALITGRIIALPAANFPAVMAGSRLSPIDQGNLNRSFPGDPDGTPTRALAHYIESVLLPMADILLDLHSGGASMVYLPTALARGTTDAARAAGLAQLLHVFAAPVSVVGSPAGMSENRTLEAAAERHGVLNLGIELGGGARVTPAALAIARRGVRRVMRHMGLVADAEDGPPTEMMEVSSDACFVYASDWGLFEPLVELGDDVREGQPIGRLHSLETPWREPVEERFRTGGRVVCLRARGRSERGDCLGHVATARG
ncbi:succinylglutamate desuccinylase/aspartoacylase family protein [Elioraea sp.]|uniref:succinylglutamate desuccinylase/aspartoacylase family protein n=1 Tax=Elioraea sp. TaxID=2185103 RepID=UPI0025B80C37|nr:succinylglutamate desuccinylase/aspartoacylase family protein [Elioraea sp.]